MANKKSRSRPRNGVIRALVEQGLISRMAGRTIPSRKGKGARYDRKSNKSVQTDSDSE